MYWICRRLGRRLGRVLLPFIIGYFLAFAPEARRASRHYLQRVTRGGVGLRDSFRHFWTFASTILDRVYLLADEFDRFDIRLVGEEAIAEAVADPHGAFLLGAHFGSFEVIRAVGRRIPRLRAAMAMYEDNARKINAILEAVNPELMRDIIPLGRFDSMLKVHERLQERRVVGMLGDRSLGEEPVSRFRFLGQEVMFPLGPMRLAAILHRPVLFMAGIYLGGNRYEVHFERLADFSTVAPGKRSEAIQKAMECYVKRLEWFCRKWPYNWFNFYEFWPEPGRDGEVAG
jgi:predicted LPLAT superfamily acyltransferase